MEFYKRPTPLPRIHDATRVLNKYKKYMIPSAFDIILENPIETVEDTRATVDMSYDMLRPYTPNVVAKFTAELNHTSSINFVLGV
jgi:hypothetical protein